MVLAFLQLEVKSYKIFLFMCSGEVKWTIDLSMPLYVGRSICSGVQEQPLSRRGGRHSQGKSPVGRYP